MTNEPEVMRIYVTHDDGTEGRYDVTAVRVSTPVSVSVEHGQLVLEAKSDA